MESGHAKGVKDQKQERALRALVARLGRELSMQSQNPKTFQLSLAHHLSGICRQRSGPRVTKESSRYLTLNFVLLDRRQICRISTIPCLFRIERPGHQQEELSMHKFLQLTALVTTIIVFQLAPQNVLAGNEKSVLVTGASSGIGRNLAETLASKGYHVYAGARKDKDLAALDAIENITAVRLDVTKQDQIDAVVARVNSDGGGLWGLVNNAGVGGGGSIIDTPIEDQNFVFSVNVEGVYRTTKAFAPLVMASKGRIVTTGSIAGTLSWAGGSAYSGSKHAIEAFTDALAAEMEPHGVSVSVVEPGNYKSNIRRSSTLRKLDRVRDAGGEVTDDMKKQYDQTAARELSYKEPDEVSEAFMHALFDVAPLRRYMVVPNAREQEMTIRTKINELVQLNTWGPYSYSRDQLVEMIDQALNPSPETD